MLGTRTWAGLILAAIVVSAYAPPPPRASEPSVAADAAAPITAARTLVLIARGEPHSLALRAFQQAGGNSNSHTVFNAGLDEVDEIGNPRAVLAVVNPYQWEWRS
jgi:hypothetical protein